VKIATSLKKILDIPGDYLEAGGQILRTAVALSCILNRPVRIFNIRAKRPRPGLRPQHLHILKALSQLFKADTQGIELDSKEVVFVPHLKVTEQKELRVDLQTAGSIGLFLQSFLLVSAFGSAGLSLEIKGGTCGLGAIPVDYYPLVVLPILKRTGLEANLEIIKRGYYPKGGGEVRAEIQRIAHPQEIILKEQGRLVEIKGMSIASSGLRDRRVSERQAEQAQKFLQQKYSLPVKIEAQYASTLSIGSEINLYAYTDSGCILWSDARGELKKSAEHVGKEAADKLSQEIESRGACDLHLADNLIPWLAFLGGEIKTSEITLHTQANIWLCELFLGKKFNINGNVIACLGIGGGILNWHG
jgi:RNA 3'-terminal phosphate cyclase (GTP)